MMQRTILLVDDETKILILLKDFLSAEGYQVITAGNGKEALERFWESQQEIDLVILDVMMPEVDGWTVCREIRKTSRTPVFMLTARGEDYDEVHGFEIGADDYVKKPVRPAALVARINALFHRMARVQEKDYCFGALELRPESHIVLVEGIEISLSPKEYALLVLLMENAGKVISREQLLNQVWGYDYFGGLRTVDTHINRLRIKLGSEGERVATVRGFGYRFEAKL